MTNPADTFSESVRACAECIREIGPVAVAGLYDLTAPRLVRFSTAITRNQQDAEDAVSAALLRVVSDSTLLANTIAPWSYLLRMVRNESLVILRRRKRWSIAKSLVDLWTWTRVDELEREESIRAVWSALRTLPTEQSEVVVLKVWEGLTFQQIAEVLEIPAPTAASRYRYALGKLSHLLEPAVMEVHDA